MLPSHDPGGPGGGRTMAPGKRLMEVDPSGSQHATRLSRAWSSKLSAATRELTPFNACLLKTTHLRLPARPNCVLCGGSLSI